MVNINTVIYDGLTGVNVIPNPTWSLEKAQSETFKHAGFYIENIYDYTHYDLVCHAYHSKDNEEEKYNTLDQHMWKNFADILENNRKVVYDTCVDYGVGESESHFLSIKFLWSALRKFRSKFFREMNGIKDRSDYDKTPLKTAVNALIRRVEAALPDKEYLFSVEAANGELSYFRKQCAWEAARYLAEDSGIIFYAKITI